MEQEGRGTAWIWLCGSVLLGAWMAACDPTLERGAPWDEASLGPPVVVAAEPADEPATAVCLEQDEDRPLPPPASLARGAPAVAYASGKSLVVWEDVREGGIYGARLKSDGTLLDPEGFRVNIGGEGGHSPAIAYDGRNFVVVWEDLNGISAVRVRPNGTVLGPVLTISSSDEAHEPAIACAPRKVCLVSYTAEGDFDSAIGFRLVTSDGTVIQPPPDFSFGTPGAFASDSSVAWNHKEFLIVWSDTRGGVETPDIFGGRVRHDGVRASDKGGFPISTAAGAQTSPDVAWTGRWFLTVWEDTREDPGGDIFGARVRKDETVDDRDGIPISAGGPGFPDVAPAVAHNNSRSLVVWRRGDAIHGAQVHGDGGVLDPAGFLIADEFDEQYLPDVASGDNRFLTLYGRGSSSEPPFLITGKFVKPDTRVGPLIDSTRTSMPMP